MADRLLPPHVSRALRAPELELDLLRLHRVDHQPSGHVLELGAHPLLRRHRGELRAPVLRRHATAAGRLVGEELGDLRRDEEGDGLPLADPAHAVRCLRVVAKGEVLAEGEHRDGVRLLRDVHPRRVHLIVEGEALVGRRAAPLEVHDVARGAQHDLLVPARLEEDDAFHLRRQPVQQVRGDLAVVHAGDERAAVDERAHGRLHLGEQLQHAGHVPVGGQHAGRDDGGVGERAQHLRVVAHRVDAGAHLERQQRGGRAGEGDAAREEHLAAQVLAVGRQLRALVRGRLREDHVVEVELDGVWQLAQQLEEHAHVVDVHQVEQVQREDVPHVWVAVAAERLRDGRPHRLSRVALRGLWRRRRRRHRVADDADGGRARRLGLIPRGALSRRALGPRELLGRRARLCRLAPLQRLCAAHAPAGRLDPLHPEERGWPLELGADLRLEHVAQVLDERAEVGLAQPLVAVREDRDPDGHVGVRKLGRGGRRVLPDEGDGHVAARARQGAVALHRDHLWNREEAEVDARDLAQHVRQQVGEPVVAEVEHLGLLVRERGAVCHRALDAAAGEAADRGVVRDVVQTGAAEPDEQPGAHQRLERRVVPLLREEGEVGHALHVVARDALLARALQPEKALALRLGRRGRDALAGRRAVAAREAGAAAAAGQPARALRLGLGLLLEQQQRVQHPPWQLPPRGRKVERVLVAERPVELRLERVEEQVDLVHDEARRAVDGHHLDEGTKVDLHARVLLAPRVAQHVHLLEHLELQRLDGRRGAQHDAAVAPRREQLLDGAPPELRRALEDKREDPLAHDRREGGAQGGLALLQECLRHRLQHERLPVAEHQRQHRPHNRRLAAAHQHLLDKRLSATHRLHKLADQ
mmetsp:Transcript_25500/g.83297  ORF Transcript_25500/g.83297 Transcript_25500/m.83297 type:complete len:871 (-) Transcript_25500:87-2699(-)